MNLILITSVINTPNLPLSYSNVRSIYSMDERFQQTKETIISIKNKIPNNKIFMVECSILNKEHECYLKQECEYFLNLYSKKELLNKIFGLSKSLGEGTMTIEALRFLIDNKIEFDNLFKISGRYWLSNNFEYEKFNNSNVVVKKINNNIDNIFTALYKIPKIEIYNLYIFLQKNINLMDKNIGYEVLFALFIKSININIDYINPIGLQGYITVDGSFYNG